MDISCLVLPHAVASGPANMALDEALLDAVAEDPSRAYFRTYGWDVPTLSLGYFQSLAEAEADPRWRSVAIVRRPTGGGALWHHHEVTYALVVPGNHPYTRPSQRLYHTIHAAIAACLCDRGLEAKRRGATEERRIRPSRPFLCFTDQDSEDIVAKRFKVVGSAQRRRLGAVLQHGALLLARSDSTPELPGASDLGPVPCDPALWAEVLQIAIPRSLGLRPEDHKMTDTIQTKAAELERTVYRARHWTARR